MKSNGSITYPLFFFILLCFYLHTAAQLPLQPIGMWRDHLPYHVTIDVETDGEIIFAATPYSFYTVDPADNTVIRFSRVSGLSETGVAVVSFNNISGKLLVAYTNSNLDMVFRKDVFNIPDVLRDNITGDKKIIDIYPHQRDFYLSTGLGIIVIDGDKYEVKDTWIIGNGGTKIKVNSITYSNSFFYAATEEGLKRVANTLDPADHQNWQTLSGSAGLPPGEVKDVVTTSQGVVALLNESLFIYSNNSWQPFFSEGGWNIRKMNITEGQIALSMIRGDEAKIILLNANGSISRTIIQSGVIKQPRGAVMLNNEVWVADSIGGLSRFAGSHSRYQLNSPRGIATGQLLVHNGVVYAAAGGVDENWIQKNDPNGLYKFDNGTWTNYNLYSFPQLDSLKDVMSIAVDRDGSVWAGSFGEGLLHITTPNTFQSFKHNSPVMPAVLQPGSYRVTGLAFDKEGNLWMSNHGSHQPLLVKTRSGTWKSFALPVMITGNPVHSILVDDEDHKWIISLGNGIFTFDHGSSIDDNSDDKWKHFKAGIGNGNLPSNNVLSIAKDSDGFIWLGTDDGIAIVPCGKDIFSSPGCEAILPVVQQGGFNNYLFKGERVNAIAVDGANRKWVGTTNGAWLINAEGDEIIYHFTTESGPLLSNDVRAIAVDNISGEVFFSTIKGIVSFRSTATTGSNKNENVLVFPNPVPPGYNGTIAIRGITNNAIVKITGIDGRLVYETRALGGQAIWNGRNYKGQKISSGIYLVFVTDESRKEDLVTKIIFIQSN